MVKDIWLSENVIGYMKETFPSGPKSQQYSGVYGSSVSDEELERRVAEEQALEQTKKESENQKQLKQGKELNWKDFCQWAVNQSSSSQKDIKWRRTNQGSTWLNNWKRKIKWYRGRMYSIKSNWLEERSSEFYKVTIEKYQKVAEGREAKFKQYEFHPAWADMQTKILQL